MKLWRYGRPIESLGQRYRLDGMLGSGGMADVCLAWDEREGREAAVKILKSDDLDQETLNRFMKEAAQIAGWQHPNILRIYESMQIELIDAAQGSVLFYMVTEYARGGDLHKRLTPGRPFPPAATFALFRQLCGAVQYAHEQGVIHRDLKPLNVLFRRPARGPEEVVLSDFGLAVQVEASHHTFARGGTLAYMAPEQFQGNSMQASDLFALGVILYQLCTGHLPFRRALGDLPRLVDNSPSPLPVRPGLLNPELPPALDEILLRALRELPTERYRSAQEFWDAIALALLSAAPTFAIDGATEYAAGQTWPIGNSDQFPAPLASSDYDERHSARDAEMSASPLPAEPQSSTGEGPVSELGSVREKQKASPGMVPGMFLPTHSIPASPNPGARFAEEFAPARLLPLEDPRQHDTARDEQSQVTGAVWGEERAQAGETKREPASDPPITSASGSTTLPRPPRTHANQRASKIPQRASAKRLPIDTQPHASQASVPISTYSAAKGSRRQACGSTFAANSGQAAPTESNSPPNAFQQELASSSPACRAASLPPVPPPAHIPRPHFVGAGEARTNLAKAPRTRSKLATRIQPARAPRQRKIPLVPTIAAVALLLAIFLAAGAQGSLLRFFGAPITTVTLTPRSQMIQQDLALSAIAANPDPARSQIQARLLSTTSPTQSTIANASGSIAAKKATGQLTFINDGSTPVTIATTVISGGNGIQVSFNGSITIPAVPPSSVVVTGFAVNSGAAGNIPVLDIVKPCCAANIVVKNTSAFTGGQDAQPDSVIRQKDIDDAANGLAATLKAGTLNSLASQVRGNERVVDGSQQCQPQVNADHQAGDVARSVTVQVALACSEQVYNYGAAQQIALNALQRQVASDPNLGAAYTLDGQIALNVLSATQPGADGSFTLTVRARGLWVYHFSPTTLRQLAAQIAGKSESDARALLLRQPGIIAAQIHPSGALPVNTGEIQIALAQLPGAAPAPAGTP